MLFILQSYSVQVNKLVLSEGEDKLRRLIQQKKFAEAESYALNNDLDVEVHIICVHINSRHIINVHTMKMY